MSDTGKCTHKWNRQRWIAVNVSGEDEALDHFSSLCYKCVNSSQTPKDTPLSSSTRLMSVYRPSAPWLIVTKQSIKASPGELDLTVIGNKHLWMLQRSPSHWWHFFSTASQSPVPIFRWKTNILCRHPSLWEAWVNWDWSKSAHSEKQWETK